MLSHGFIKLYDTWLHETLSLREQNRIKFYEGGGFGTNHSHKHQPRTSWYVIKYHRVSCFVLVLENDDSSKYSRSIALRFIMQFSRVSTVNVSLRLPLRMYWFIHRCCGKRRKKLIITCKEEKNTSSCARFNDWSSLFILCAVELVLPHFDCTREQQPNTWNLGHKFGCSSVQVIHHHKLDLRLASPRRNIPRCSWPKKSYNVTL